MSTLLAETLLAVAASPAASLVAKATLTLALALLLARMARRSRAAVRHVLLAAAFASLLILPGASLVLPSIAVEVPVAAHTATNASLPQPHVAITAPAPVSAGAPSDIAAPGTSAVSSRSIGAAIWGVGALIFLVPVAAGIWQTRRLLRRSAA